MTIRQRSPLPRTGSVRAGFLAALLITACASARAAGGFPQCAALDTPVFLVGDATPASCTQAALQTALDTAGAMGGGRIFFLCGPEPVTIALSSTLTPPDNTTIDGGGLITLGAAFALEESVTVGANTTIVLKNLSVVGPARQAIVTISGMLTVCNCTFSGPTSLLGRAINNFGTLIVTNSTFSFFGTFVAEGSAIANAGTAIVNRSTFRRNVARNAGAILNGGTLEVKNSFFFDNSVDGAFGDGGAIKNSGTLTVTNSEFRGNFAAFAGAISHVGGSLIVRNSTFFNNHASRGSGGISSGGTLTVRHSEFVRNSGFSGGGLTIGGNATIIDSTVAQNLAVTSGGGLTIGGNATIINSTVTLNRALGFFGGAGGGICVAPSGTLNISPSSSVTGNTPDDIANPCNPNF